MSKSSELDQTVKNYLLAAMEFEGYEENLETMPSTTEEKIEACKKIFNIEVGYWMTPRSGQQEAIKYWLAGLPSSIHIDFANSDIIDLAVKWGSLPENPTESQMQKILDNWFNLLAAKLLQLFNGYRIPKN